MPTVADLFCGAGGFSLGFKEAGFQPVFGIDHDKWSCATYARNIGPHVINAPIETVRAKYVDGEILWKIGSSKTITPQIDVLLGGPPCQGFSRLNRTASTDDPRNSLWKQYYRLLKGISPRIFVIENVPALLDSQEYAKLVRRARIRGYSIASGILRAELFGVPQKRRRAFVIGVLGESATLPIESYNSRKLRTVADAFEGLSIEPNGHNLHLARKPTELSQRRYAAIPPGGNRFDLPYDLQAPCWRKKISGSVDVFGRMRYDKPAPTIRTEFIKPEKGRYLHPEADRPITLREGARLQTFPDDFEFLGAATQIAKQIGNAVPPELARTIASHLLRIHFNKEIAAA